MSTTWRWQHLPVCFSLFCVYAALLCLTPLLWNIISWKGAYPRAFFVTQCSDAGGDVVFACSLDIRFFWDWPIAFPIAADLVRILSFCTLRKAQHKLSPSLLFLYTMHFNKPTHTVCSSKCNKEKKKKNESKNKIFVDRFFGTSSFCIDTSPHINGSSPWDR